MLHDGRTHSVILQSDYPIHNAFADGHSTTKFLKLMAFVANEQPDGPDGTTAAGGGAVFATVVQRHYRA